MFFVFDVFICYVAREYNTPVRKEGSSLSFKSFLPSFDVSLMKEKNNIIWMISCIPQAAVNALPYIFIPGNISNTFFFLFG